MANHQANYILEKIHQVIVNLVHTSNLKNNCLDEDDPWSGNLAATTFAVRITHRTTLQATPEQLMFVHDMILNNPFITDWEAIWIPKKKLIDKNNKNENKIRKPYSYKVHENY